MDVAMLTGKTLRIKGKNSSVIINPTKELNKTEGSCVLNLKNEANFSDTKIEGSRITIEGPGEFDVGGIKISVLKTSGSLVARMDVDSVKLLVGKGEAMEKVQDKVEDSDILVVEANESFNFSSLTSLNPKIVLGYGESVSDLAKSFGQNNPEKTHKFSTTAAKLPSELEFIHLA
jgi:hypothetical protein